MRSVIKQLVIAALIGVTSLAPKFAHAATSDCRGTGTPTLGSSVSLSNLNIPRDLPLGAAIPGGKQSISLSVSCPSTTITGGQSWAMGGYEAVTAVPGLSNVYTISGGPSGIGFRILDASGNAMPIGTVGGTANAANLGAAPAGQTSFSWHGALELVKVAEKPVAGSQSIKLYTRVYNQAWANQNADTSAITISYTIAQPTLTTCTVTNATQTVTLPNISIATANANSTDENGGYGSGFVPFSISLSCSAGAQLFMIFTDANNPANTGEIVRATGAPNAGDTYGVGIQYRSSADEQIRIKLGPDSPTAGTINQIKIGSTPNGAMSLNFRAFYAHNPGAQFPVGAVNARTTFTFSYQ